MVNLGWVDHHTSHDANNNLSDLQIESPCCMFTQTQLKDSKTTAYGNPQLIKSLGGTNKAITFVNSKTASVFMRVNRG